MMRTDSDRLAGSTRLPAAKTGVAVRRGWLRLALAALVLFLFFGGILPAITETVPILSRMAGHLESTGIDPTRYYYTDVEQVAESERYLQTALRSDADR